MKRFIKTETSTGVLYFRTFANCLGHFKLIDESKLKDDKDTYRIYKRHYTKLQYWKFTDVNFDFGKVSRIEFINTK